MNAELFNLILSVLTINNLIERLQKVTLTSETTRWIEQLDQMERTLQRNMEAVKK